MADNALTTMSLAQLGAQAGAHVAVAAKAVGKYNQHYKAAGIYLIEARKRCVDEDHSWPAFLKRHNIRQSQASASISEAGGAPGIPGVAYATEGIAAKAPGTRKEQVRRANQTYRAKQKQLSIGHVITRSGVPPATQPPEETATIIPLSRSDMLLKIRSNLSRQSAATLVDLLRIMIT